MRRPKTGSRDPSSLARAFVLAAALLAPILAVPGCGTAGAIERADGSIDAHVLYQRRCGQCHALFRPEEFTDEEWAENVRRFSPRAGVRPAWRPALVAWLQQANDVPR